MKLTFLLAVALIGVQAGIFQNWRDQIHSGSAVDQTQSNQALPPASEGMEAERFRRLRKYWSRMSDKLRRQTPTANDVSSESATIGEDAANEEQSLDGFDIPSDSAAFVTNGEQTFNEPDVLRVGSSVEPMLPTGFEMNGPNPLEVGSSDNEDEEGVLTSHRQIPRGSDSPRSFVSAPHAIRFGDDSLPENLGESPLTNGDWDEIPDGSDDDDDEMVALKWNTPEADTQTQEQFATAEEVVAEQGLSRQMESADEAANFDQDSAASGDTHFASPLASIPEADVEGLDPALQQITTETMPTEFVDMRHDAFTSSLESIPEEEDPTMEGDSPQSKRQKLHALFKKVLAKIFATYERVKGYRNRVKENGVDAEYQAMKSRILNAIKGY